MLDDGGIPHTEEEPYLLFLDGHKTRLAPTVLRFCKANYIEPYLFPPHATTLYQ